MENSEKKTERKPLLREDGPLISFLTRLCDLIILNLLWIVCCIPVVTIGAATSALYFTTLKLAGREDCGIVRTFFRGLTLNFVQASGLWLGVLLAVFVISADLMYGWQNSSEALGLLMLIVGAVLLLLLLCVCTWLFPVQARFQNTIPCHIQNALALFRLNLPKSLLIWLIWSVPVVVTITFTELQYQLLFLWMICGFAALFFLSSLIFRDIFDKVQLENECAALQKGDSGQ